MFKNKYSINVPLDLIEKKKKEGWSKVKETGKKEIYSMSQYLADFSEEKQLEIKMRSLFKELDFTDRIDGGQDNCEEVNFNFNECGTQIDVMGGVDNVFIVLDCTRSNKFESYIKTKIQHNEAERKKIDNWLKAKFGNKYSELIIGICYDNFEPTSANKKECKEKGIALINFNFFDNCLDQLDILDKDSLKHQILKRILETMGKSKLLQFDNHPYELKALRGRSGDNSFYTFYLQPHELHKLAYVKRLHEEEEVGYQRHLKRKKINSINQFLYETENCFFNNLIVWFNKEPIFDEKKEILKLDKIYCSLEVIDGQHRLFGYNYTPKRVTEEIEENIRKVIKKREETDQIIVTGFYSPDPQKRINTFIDINNNQTKVPTESVLQQMYLTGPKTEDGLISRFIQKKLNEEKSSCFYKVIKIDNEKRAHLSFTQIHRYAIKKARLFRNDLEWSLYRQCGGQVDRNDNYPQREEILTPLFNCMLKQINTYFNIIQRNYKEDWEQKDEGGFTFSNNGIVILFRLYAYILYYLHFKQIDIRNEKATILMNEMLKTSINNIIDEENHWEASSEGMKDRLLKEIIKRIKTNKQFSDFPESLPKK